MNHKRGRPANRRAGCKMCKPWKVNWVGKAGNLGDLPEKASDHKRRHFAEIEISEAKRYRYNEV